MVPPWPWNANTTGVSAVAADAGTYTSASRLRSPTVHSFFVGSAAPPSADALHTRATTRTVRLMGTPGEGERDTARPTHSYGWAWVVRQLLRMNLTQSRKDAKQENGRLVYLPSWRFCGFA